MNYRKLGSSDLEVSEISLGSWLTYSGGVERDQTEACTRAAFDAGITFFDTANAYGDGAAEEAWGEILKGYDRDSYVLATKVFFPMQGRAGPVGASRSTSRSTRRWSACRPTTSTSTSAIASTLTAPVEETMEALSEVVRAGQGPLPRLLRVDARADPRRRSRSPGAEKFVSSQPQYSMLWQAPEDEVFPSAPSTASRRSCGRRWPRAC